MADDISKERSQDPQVIVTNTNAGPIDDIFLDFPGEGDEGIEVDKGRKPTSARKKFVIEALKGIGGGVKAATKAELSRVMPDAAAVVTEAGNTIEDFKMLKDDLGRQITPIVSSVENATRRLLPRVESYLPKKIYDKISKKLEDRAKLRQSYTSKSKTETERDQIAAELAEIFGAQQQSNMENLRQQKVDTNIDRALGAFRHKQSQISMLHVYDAVRSTELFHKTQHMAYMKKSLELKYKSLYMQRDTFNLLQQSMRTYEGYFKAITKNTSLPDVMKKKYTDFIYESNSRKYGTMMSTAMGNIRGKIFDKIKSTARDFLDRASFVASSVDLGSEMMDGFGGQTKGGGAGGLLGKALGYFGTQFLGSEEMGRMFPNKINQKVQKIFPFLRTLNKNIAGVRGNIATRMADWQTKMANSSNPILNWFADFIPNSFTPHTGASNDLLSGAEKPVPFDTITRQSITEIIPGYLGKILLEVSKIRNPEAEEQVYNVYERRFTSVGDLKQSVENRAFGSEEFRRDMLSRTLATMQAGAGRNRPDMDPQKMYKGLEKDINRFLINHAVFGQGFKPRTIHEFLISDDSTKQRMMGDSYIQKISKGFEHPISDVFEAIMASMYTENGELDRNVKNDIDLAITEYFRKQDQFKSSLPKDFETFGYGRFFESDLSKKEIARLTRLSKKGGAFGAAAKRKLDAHAGILSRDEFGSQLNLDKIAETRAAGVNYGDIDLDKQYDWLRHFKYDDYQKNDVYVTKMLEAGDYIGLNKLIMLATGGKGKLSKIFGRLFAGPWDEWTFSPEEMSARVDQMTAEQKAKFARGLAMGLGIIARGEGNKYEDLFKVSRDFKDSGKPKQKMSFSEAFNDIKNKVTGSSKEENKTDTTTAPTTNLGTGITSSDVGSETTTLWQRSKNAVGTVVNAAKQKFVEGAAAAGGLSIPLPEIGPAAQPDRPAAVFSSSAAGPGSGLPPPEEPPSSDAGAFGSQFDRIYSLLESWKTENTENQGTIFDAVAQIDSTLKSMKSGIGVGGVLNEEELAKQLNKDKSKNSLLRKGLHAAKEGVAGTVKGVGKMYTRIYGAALKGAGTAMKGIGFAAGRAIDNVSKGIRSTAKWLTHKEDYVDVYVKGKEGGMPLVSARKQRDPDEGIFFKSSGKRVMKSSDIDQPCVDRSGNLVITEDDIKTGLVMSNSSPIGKIGSGLLSLGKGYFSIYGKALTGIASVTKTVAQGLFGKASERWQDIYRKDEVGKGPLITARQQKEDGVYYFESGKKVEKSSDIHEPVCDKDRKILISKDDIEHGLVNVDNKPLGSGATGGALRALLRGVGGALPGLGKLVGKVGGGLAEIYTKGYKGLMDLGFGAIKGAGKFLGRALGLNISGEGVGDGKKTISILESIQKDVALIAEPYKKRNPNDKDGDGDIDGSYADQMEKRKKEENRLDARDLHKDVNWNKDEKEDGGGNGGKGDDGSGIFDLVDKFVPKKWKRRLKALKKVYGKKFMRFAKGAGDWLLKSGRGMLGTIGKGLGTAGKFLGGKLGALGSKALPMLGTAGKFIGSKAALLGAKALPMLGTAGSAIGGILGSAGTAISGALGSMGGLAGIGSSLAAAGSAALPFLGPAALAALAGYGIYRGVKGFSKKNALENVGKSEGISNENQLTGEDRMYSALGMNSKIGAKAAKFTSQALGIHGLIKGIRGNDNPLTDKEIEAGRGKLQRKIDKGLKGYDRILQEYEKAIDAGNWRRARELSGQEADGLIKSMWKNSIGGMAVKGIGNLIFGNKDKEMTKEEIQKTRDEFNSKIKKGGNVGKNAEKLLSKFDDAVAEQDWKKAREIAGAEQRGLFGKLFQDSRGNIKWGTVVGGVLGGIPGMLVGSLFNKTDVNKPMTEEEVKSNRERLLKLVNAGGNGAKAAQKVLDQFDEAVTEQNWKKARQLCGEEVKSNLAKLGGALQSTAKWSTRIATLGLSTLFESDQEKPMTEEEIKKFTDKMNFLINKHHDKVAQRKLDRFEECVAAQKWDKARQIAKMPHKSMIARAAKAYFSFWWGDDEKPMEEAEMQKFRDSMDRKIKLGGATARMAQKKLEAFEDAVGAQRWKRARTIANSPNDGLYQKAGKAYGKFVANNFRFWFGGDGKPMTPEEIEQTRKELGWAIQEGKKGAQKRLDRFEDLVADEKWEKARALAKMPYDNVVSRVAKSVGSWLFGNDKNAMSPEEIDKFRGELEQKIADNPNASGKLNKMLDQFNSAVESENWAKARKISGNKDWGFLGSVAKGVKALNPFSWFSSSYDDCQKLKTEIEEKIDDEGDDSGMISKGLQHFDVLVRRQQYDAAEKFGKDLLKMKVNDLLKKHGDLVSTDEYKAAQKEAEKLQDKIAKATKETGFFNLLRKTKLAMLKMRLKNNPDQWANEDFMSEIRDSLAEITGEGAYDDIDKPDDAAVKSAETLIKDIDKTAEGYSWFTSPIIKSKLKLLKREVEGDMDNWDEGTIQEWRERLQEIAGSKAVDSRSVKAQTEGAEAQAEERKDITVGNTEHVDSINFNGNPFVEGTKAAGDFVVDAGKQIYANAKHTGGVIANGIGSAIAAQGNAFQNGVAASTYGAVGHSIASTIQKVGNKGVASTINTGSSKVGSSPIKNPRTAEEMSAEKFASDFVDEWRTDEALKSGKLEKLYKKYNVAFNGDFSNFSLVAKEAALDYLRTNAPDMDLDDKYDFIDEVDMYITDGTAGKAFVGPAGSSHRGVLIAGQPVGDKLTKAQVGAIDMAAAMGNNVDKMYGPEIMQKYREAKSSKSTSDAAKADFEDNFASGGFATSATPSIDADGNPILYGEAGTEAIMPIRSKPGNLLSRVGSKVGDILSGKSVGPMSDGADSASVHAGTDESEPMENMMANELAKTVKRHYSRGGFALFEEGGFVDNIKERTIAFGEEAALAALAPIASTVLGAAIASIVPILVVLLGPALMTFIGLISTAMMVEYYEKGEYGKMAGVLLAGGIAAPLIIAVFALLGIGGAALGGVIAAGGAVASAEALLRGINKALLPKNCQEVVNDAIGFIGKVYTDVTTAALGTAATAVTAPMTLGKAAITGDFNRSEYIREGESALGTVLNAPHRALDNAAGWAGVGINKAATGIGGLFGIGGDNVEAEAKRQMKNGGFARFANGGFLGSSSHPELLSGGSPNKPLVDLIPPKPQPAGDGLLSALTSTVTDGTNPAEALQKFFSGGSANNGKELADQLAALAKSNQQIYELLESALTGAGVKIQGMEDLTAVCSQPSVSSSTSETKAQVIQVPDPGSTGLDLRKRQA